MLAKKFRLSTAIFKDLKKKEPVLRFSFSYGTLLAYASEAPYSRVGIIARNNLFSSIVARNKVRRMIYDAAGAAQIVSRPGYDIVVVLRSGSISLEVLQNDLLTAQKKLI